MQKNMPLSGLGIWAKIVEFSPNYKKFDWNKISSKLQNQ